MSDGVIYPGRDPLAPLAFMATAKRIPFILAIKSGDSWSSTRHQLNRAFENYLTGMFEVLLGDESKLQDDSAEFVLYVEPEEVEKAQAIIDHVGKNNG
jgi:hypothetical protein